MEHQHDSEISDKYIKEDDEHSTTEDRISISSISSASDIKSATTDFSFDDKYHIDKLGKGSIVVDSEEIGGPQMVTEEDTSTLEWPASQVMERPPESSGYRIPSYVFATTKSSHQEWSTTSNESLFSIHTGNMSFTRDQFSWLLKSGELGMYGDIRKSGELPPPPPSPVNINMPRLLGEQSVLDLHKHETTPSSSSSRKTVVDDSGDDEIMPSNSISITSSCQVSENGDYPVTSSSQISENNIDDDSEVATKKNVCSVTASPSDDVPLTTCISHHSDTSVQSFAFPVLAEIGRDKSVNSGQSHARIDLRKNHTVKDQEAAKPPNNTTAQSSSSSYYYTWLSSCFCCCSCCSCCKEA